MEGADTLLDRTMASAPPGQVYTVLPAPMRGSRTLVDLEHPITMEDFTAHALRSVHGVRTAWALFDVQKRVPESGWQSLSEHVAAGRLEALPHELVPCASVPEGGRMDIVVINNGDGSMDVLKMFIFDKPAPLRDVARLGRGTLYVPQHRAGPWAVKKTIVSMLHRIPGYFVSWVSVIDKTATQLTK